MRSLRAFTCVAAFAISMVAVATSARADQTRAIVDAATTHFARVFTRLAYSRASVVRAGAFAVFSALNGEAGSGAFLRRRDGRWRVLIDAKGLFSEDMFTSDGASPETADRLAIPCPPSTGSAAAVPTPVAVRRAGSAYVVTTTRHRSERVTARTVTIPAERVLFTTTGVPTMQTVARTIVTVCE